MAMDTNDSLVNKAYRYFNDGDYVSALRAFQEAGDYLGQHVFEVNIRICRSRMKEDQGHDRQEVTSKPRWQLFRVHELIPHRVKAKVRFEKEQDQTRGAALARVVYLDKNHRELLPPYPGLAQSDRVGPYFYINAAGKSDVQLIPPKGAVEVAIGLQKWRAEFEVRLEGGLSCEPATGMQASSGGIPQSLGREAPARRLADVKVAAILDEFTLECFKHEVNLTELTPDAWEAELEKSKPDFLFVESCWFGNGNRWSGLIYGYTENGQNRMDELQDVVRYCRRKGIPTVFWAKEDPIHYKRFGPTAKIFDFVFTTDANMIPAYKKDFGIEAQPLSFFCQPRIHNPTPIVSRWDKACFAGSYYSKKRERCDNFHTIMQAIEQAGIECDIFDRCLKRGVSHFEFPEKYKRKVVGYLEPDEMYKAYKGYRYTVNLNTVKHSPTMFARRVYESLASGAPVISNYSEGVITQFGGIVCASDRKEKVVEYLKRLEDPAEYDNIVARGVRETLGHHTLADRLEQVCDRLGISVIPHLPLANAVYTAGTKAEVEQARAHFQEQDYHRKRLVVNLENSNILYPYLNRNNEEEVFRVLTEFAKPLEGIEVPMRLDTDYPDTHLEDAAIKTQYEEVQKPVTERREVVV